MCARTLVKGEQVFLILGSHLRVFLQHYPQPYFTSPPPYFWMVCFIVQMLVVLIISVLCLENASRVSLTGLNTSKPASLRWLFKFSQHLCRRTQNTEPSHFTRHLQLPLPLILKVARTVYRLVIGVKTWNTDSQACALCVYCKDRCWRLPAWIRCQTRHRNFFQHSNGK